MANTRCFRSVCLCHPARGEEKRRTEETSPCDSWQSISFLGQLFSRLRGWMPRLVTAFRACLHTQTKDVSFVTCLCAPWFFFNPAYVSSSSCWHTFGINISGQNPCKLLWRFVIRAVSLHNILLYTTRKHQKILEHDGGSRNPIKYTRYDHWKVCSPYFSGAFCSIR